MRLAMLAALAAGCGGRASPPAPPPSALPGFAAARWVPERPLYVLASPSVADAQRAARDAIDLIAAATGYDLDDAMRASAALFGVDALHPDPLAAIGVDLGGGWAMFGGDPGAPDPLSPTMVVHLAAPAQMAAFLDRQRERGLVTRSMIADRTEVVSAVLPSGFTVSWAIERSETGGGEWMWVHVAPAGTSDDGARWFTASHGRHDAGWTGGWAWAQRAAGAAAGVVGVFERSETGGRAPRGIDVHGALAGAVARLPDALACARLAEAVGRVSLAVEGDEHHVSARLAFDVGSTDRLRALLLPAPSGWDATARAAAIAVQWNLDLAGLRPLLAPCLAALGAPVALADETGVRAARAMLVGFDPDAVSGTGAVALDLASTAYVERQLDRIPLRQTLERARTFGPYRGHAIALPLRFTIEYVLEHGLAIAALGDGLLARLVAPAAAPGRTPLALASLDVAPPAMSAHAWEVLLDALAERLRTGANGAPSAVTRQVVAHLMGWRDGHFAVTAEGSDLVVTVSGDRR
jgi:hypothetical protein